MLLQEIDLVELDENVQRMAVIKTRPGDKVSWLGCHGTSSPSSYSHFYVGSMYDDIRLHVARSYTSSADSPFSLISSLLCPTIFS